LISGASTGIGRAIAVSLAAQGYRLILLARRADKLQALASELQQEYACQCHIMVGDVRDYAAMQHAIESLPEAFAQITVLVNNAGLALGLEPAHAASWLDWQTMVETNCAALAYMTHLILPGMVARNQGHIINMGSIAGTYPYRGANVYGATKAFVAQFSLELRADLLGTAIRVTNIEPAMLSGTEFSNVRFKGDQGKADAVNAGTMSLQPESVAECVRWVLAQPAFVNINRIELMPVCQAPGGLAVHRD
jgi:3-hydroxy acid dehydrogenase/malonic semialdehyde reductase